MLERVDLRLTDPDAARPLYDLLGRDIGGDDLGVHAGLADAPGDELGVLRAEVDDEDGREVHQGAPNSWALPPITRSTRWNSLRSR